MSESFNRSTSQQPRHAPFHWNENKIIISLGPVQGFVYVSFTRDNRDLVVYGKRQTFCYKNKIIDGEMYYI